MRYSTIACVFALGACAGTQEPPPRPLGVEANLEEAQRHDEDARRHETLADEAESQRTSGPEYVCGDSVLASQTTSGGERLTPNAPCWTRESDVADRHREEAAKLRRDAKTHRKHARALLAAETEACADLPAGELDHTPFAHHEDIASVTARLEDDQLVGATIRFHDVPGLDAAWLTRAIACHQARAAAVGYDPKYMAYDPTVLPGVEIKAIDHEDGPTVEIVARDRETALITYARAEELLELGED